MTSNLLIIYLPSLIYFINNTKRIQRDNKRLASNMDIAIEVNGESIEPVCDKTNVVKVKFNDNGEERFVLIIKPCTCSIEDVIMNGINLN